MDINFPEIALSRPKADPRTVLLNKRHFLASSSDHMPESPKQPPIMRTNSASFASIKPVLCDSFIKASNATTCRLESQRSLLASSASPPSSAASLPALTNSLDLISSSQATSTAAVTTTSSLKTFSSHSTRLVKINSQSCHLQIESLLHNRFIDSLNKLYNFPKTKFLIVFIFFYCAISLTTLPSTQAIPVRRTSTSGNRLILHSNVYRERYHPDQRQQHTPYNSRNQYQQFPTRQQKSFRHQTSHRQIHRTSSYIAPILRRAQQHYRQHYQQQLQHRHHLHQRAAPLTANQQKMSYCENNKFFKNLSLQVNATLGYIKTVCNKYLKEREGKTYEEMKEIWKLLKLEIKNPDRKSVTFDNQLHQKMHDFYVNLQNFNHLAELAHKDTTDNKTAIEHGEEIKISVILTLFNELKKEIIFNMNEAEKVLNSLAIEKPNISKNDVEYNKTIVRKVRDFLIVKEFIEEVEQVAEALNSLCETNGAEQ